MKRNKKENATKRIAVVADNTKRTELIEWSYFNKDLLGRHELVAISETADIIEGTLHRPVQRLFTRDTGGYQKLSEWMEAGKIDMLFFFATPSVEKEKDADLKKLLVLAATQNILVASNPLTTSLVMNAVMDGQPSGQLNHDNPGIWERAGLFFKGFRRWPLPV